MRRRRIQIWGTAVVAIGCGAVIAFGLGRLLKYESAPGTVADVPKAWPASPISLSADGLTLVMLAHPHCPCTRASVGELAELMARVQGKAKAYVLFARPNGSGADWDDTSLRRSAAAIPGVTVMSDTAGVEACRFGAETSGHTLLFAPDGRLLFSGGITQSRGHAGDNTGASAIVSLVRNQQADHATTFVFGCSLPRADSPAPAAVAAR